MTSQYSNNLCCNKFHSRKWNSGASAIISVQGGSLVVENPIRLTVTSVKFSSPSTSYGHDTVLLSAQKGTFSLTVLPVKFVIKVVGC